jgi:hypothetical protein
MEATVTISLKELEDLKLKLEKAEDKASKYKFQKEFTITFDCTIYDGKTYKRYDNYMVRSYGNLELLKEFTNYKEVKELTKATFDAMVKDSEVIRFYNKFPKWVHKLFNC